MFAKFNEPHNRPQTSITIFFVSYILIVGTFLLNVVVAVLLDEFISAVQSGKTEARMAAQVGRPSASDGRKLVAAAIQLSLIWRMPIMKDLTHVASSRDVQLFVLAATKEAQHSPRPAACHVCKF